MTAKISLLIHHRFQITFSQYKNNDRVDEQGVTTLFHCQDLLRQVDRLCQMTINFVGAATYFVSATISLGAMCSKRRFVC